MAQPQFTTEELKTEEWRIIPDPLFDLYEVSNLGRVQRFFCSRGRKGHHILKQKPTWDGYWEVQLWKNAIGRYVKVHKLVALAFLGPRPDGKQVNHIDRVRSNSRANNFEYLTPSENMQHSLCNYTKDKKHIAIDLSRETIAVIRHEAIQGVTIAAISRKFHISRARTADIVHRRTHASAL